MNTIPQQQATRLLSASATGNGAVIVVGIDTETGRRPADVSHGEISYWADVIQTGLLAHVNNGKNDILVIGGRAIKSDVKDFWTQIGTKLGLSVTFKHRNFFGSTKPIREVSFADFALLVVATDHDAKGALHQNELDALNDRKSDVTNFLCNGGALFASSCHLENPYGYLSKFASIGITKQQHPGATPTAIGINVGFGAMNMPDGPWHTQFTSFPGYLQPLSRETSTSTPPVLNPSVNSIGGINLSQLVVELSFAKPEYCLKDPILAETTGSVGVSRHFWSIQESDIHWNRFGEEVSEWFEGMPTNRNITEFASYKNLALKCGAYYRIKLAVSGLCTDWLETTRLIRIQCPEVDAGPDKCVSCDGGFAQLGNNKVDGSIYYEWNLGIGLNQSNIANPVHQNYAGQYPITYTVTATDSNGCTNSDEVTLFCRPPTLELNAISNCCEVRLKANARNYTKIEWSTGENGVDEINTTRSGEVTVTATNACGSVSQSIKSSGAYNLRGEFNTVKYDGVFFPPNGNSDFKDKLYIIDAVNGGGIQGTPNSYNSNQHKIEIRNRWGVLIRTIESPVNCGGFSNWDVSWDGTTDQGDLVEHGAYYFLLWFKNCEYTEWTHPKVRTWIPAACIDWFTVFGVKLWCKKRDPAGPTTSDVLMTSGVVNVWYP